jgi:biotin carboxyl carrier protein
LPVGVTLAERVAGFEGPVLGFLSRLIVLQGRLAGADCGVVLRFAEGRGPAVVATYNPQHDRLPPPWLNLVLEQADPVSRQTGAVLLPVQRPGGAAGGHLVLMALPPEVAAAEIVDADEPHKDSRYLVAMLVANAEPAAAELARQQVELTLLAVRAYLARLETNQARHGTRRLQGAMDVVGAVGQSQRFTEAAMAWCNELASRWGAHRVSLGVVPEAFPGVKGPRLKLVAMSRTEKLVRKMQLVQDLEAAQEECLDQDEELLVPEPAGSTTVVRDHLRLLERHGSAAAVSLPLRRDGKVQAVVTLEHEPPPPPPGVASGDSPADERAADSCSSSGAGGVGRFTAEDVAELRLVCDMASPLLLPLRERDRWIGAKAARGTRRSAGWLIGSEHTWIKLAAIGLLAVVLALALWPGQDRVGAGFTVEPVQRQLVTAPFEGELSAVHAEPGDAVAGDDQVLAELDTAPLRLELASLRAQEQVHRREAELARREARTVDVQIAQAQADAQAARADLLEHQITQASLASSLPGVVTEGQLRRQVGRTVERGEVLYEVAPIESLRAELQVPADRAGEVRPGMRGELATAAYPTRRIGFEVERVEPAARVHEGRNVFLTRVVLDELPPWLRPGMTGSAKVHIGEAPLGVLWTRDAVNWVRMKLWI